MTPAMSDNQRCAWCRSRKELDGYLSSKAQEHDRGAQVCVISRGEEGERWILERYNADVLSLGSDFGRAKQAVQSWLKARRAIDHLESVPEQLRELALRSPHVRAAMGALEDGTEPTSALADCIRALVDTVEVQHQRLLDVRSASAAPVVVVTCGECSAELVERHIYIRSESTPCLESGCRERLKLAFGQVGDTVFSPEYFTARDFREAKQLGGRLEEYRQAGQVLGYGNICSNGHVYPNAQVQTGYPREHGRSVSDRGCEPCQRREQGLPSQQP